jgi:hypothetical protein
MRRVTNHTVRCSKPFDPYNHAAADHAGSGLPGHSAIGAGELAGDFRTAAAQSAIDVLYAMATAE